MLIYVKKKVKANQQQKQKEIGKNTFIGVSKPKSSQNSDKSKENKKKRTKGCHLNPP